MFFGDVKCHVTRVIGSTGRESRVEVFSVISGEVSTIPRKSLPPKRKLKGNSGSYGAPVPSGLLWRAGGRVLASGPLSDTPDFHPPRITLKK